MVATRPAIFSCCNCCRTDRALRELVAVRASPGARAVVLHRAVPAGSRTSRRWYDVNDGERKREGQSNLAQHDHSPQVEARSGFCGLDRGTRRLFRAVHSTGLRSVQVFVCAKRCADHIKSVVAAIERGVTSAGDVPLLRHEFRRDRTAERLPPGHRVLPRSNCYVPRSIRTIGWLISNEGQSRYRSRSISSSRFWFARLSDAFAAVSPRHSVSTSITAL